MSSSAPQLPDPSVYDLTVGEALDVFLEERRKLPSIRTLQRYCQEGHLDCFKLKTSRNGNPVLEWIINGTSLRAFVLSRPEDDETFELATPSSVGAIDDGATHRKVNDAIAPAVTSPDHSDGARETLVLPRSTVDGPDAKAPPEELGDATDVGMSRAELLIENARLTAQLDAQNDLVGELREDKLFMREEIAQHRSNDRLLADMHRETLQTLKAVAVAGRHTKIELPGGSQPGEGNDLFQDVPGSEPGGRHPAERDV